MTIQGTLIRREAQGTVFYLKKMESFHFFLFLLYKTIFKVLIYFDHILPHIIKKNTNKQKKKQYNNNNNNKTQKPRKQNTTLPTKD